MSAVVAAAAGAQAAEALMLDTVAAKRPTGGWVRNATSGKDEQAATTLFTSPAKIQTRTLIAEDREVGGRTSTAVHVEAHLPVSTAALTVGDLIEVTAAGAGSLSHAGQTYRVLGSSQGTVRTARRYSVEEVLS